MCPKKDKKSVKKSVKKPADRAKRNRVERQRDSALDDGIQGLMCFIRMQPFPKKFTRSEILELVYEESVEMLQKEAAAATVNAAAEPTPSCADGKKEEDQQNHRKDDDDDNAPPTIGQAC